MKRLFLAAALISLLPLSALGQEDLRARADAAWAARDELSKTLEAIDLFEKMAARDPSDMETRVKLARAVYWAIEQDEVLADIEDRSRMDKDKQLELAEKGIKACREVLASNENDPGARFWLIWNMAARTLAKGLFSGFALGEAIMGTIVVSKEDVNYWYGGIYCYWARVIYEIPGLLGKFFHFTDDDSVWLYEHAIATEPNYLRNHFWLADSYVKMGKKDLAKKEFQFCAGQAEGALPEVEPENKLYRRYAAKRLEKM